MKNLVIFHPLLYLLMERFQNSGQVREKQKIQVGSQQLKKVLSITSKQS